MTTSNWQTCTIVLEEVHRMLNWKHVLIKPTFCWLTNWNPWNVPICSSILSYNLCIYTPTQKMSTVLHMETNLAGFKWNLLPNTGWHTYWFILQLSSPITTTSALPESVCFSLHINYPNNNNHHPWSGTCLGLQIPKLHLIKSVAVNSPRSTLSSLPLHVPSQLLEVLAMSMLLKLQLTLIISRWYNAISSFLFKHKHVISIVSCSI